MGDQSILATMEVDLTRGSQMVYIIPDIMMTINDFYRNIQLSILTRGYDQWQGGEANLLITRGMDITWKTLFYNPITGVGLGFDLAADQSIIIEPRVRALIPTGLSLEIPWGTYGRIAARSSIALKLGIDIGAGVIDSDYRGEIFVLLFNHSDERVFIPQGLAIAQIIFEQQIIHPNIYEVTQLSTTNRGTGGFGSTDAQSSAESNSKKLKSKSKSKYAIGRWDTLGQPSGKFDYYVNYDIPKAFPDLELPPPSWDDEVVEESKPDWNVLLPKEKHALSTFLEEEALSPKEASKDLVGTTSPWTSVPQSKDPFDDFLEEDSDFSYIQYLAQLSQPKDQ
ncbi:hypothetical protein ZIOFF_062738 [Zingiber officinale]|uniref:Deoxyuridine 5'-triphosphate nucleotidohydrolase n=1 Tax=Zingiber officinale TaxID=94328 RepID=A0A8J5K9F6_ZINOF|nr:hypothetical protein ZIOFF_062738 [Zingiber officinale]